MSKDFDNTNRGSIWGNDRKESDKHPDFTGSLNVEGVEYWVSAWKRKPDASAKAPALSFSIKPKEDKPVADKGQAGRDAHGKRVDMYDEIPFEMEWR